MKSVKKKKHIALVGWKRDGRKVVSPREWEVINLPKGCFKIFYYHFLDPSNCGLILVMSLSHILFKIFVIHLSLYINHLSTLVSGLYPVT